MLPFEEERFLAFVLKEEMRYKCVGGFVYVQGDEWTYITPSNDDFWTSFPPDMKESVMTQIADDRNTHFFVLVRKDSAIQMFKYSKEKALMSLAVKETK